MSKMQIDPICRMKQNAYVLFIQALFLIIMKKSNYVLRF
jgi:hypothetical protein